MTEEQGTPQEIFPWYVKRPRLDGTPFVVKPLTEAERYANTFSDIAGKSKKAINDVNAQKQYLGWAALLLRSQSFFQSYEILVDGQSVSTNLFFANDVKGICVDENGNLRYYHQPTKNPEQIHVDMDAIIDRIVILAHSPKLVEEMEAYNRRKQEEARGK